MGGAFGHFCKKEIFVFFSHIFQKVYFFCLSRILFHILAIKGCKKMDVLLNFLQADIERICHFLFHRLINLSGLKHLDTVYNIWRIQINDVVFNQVQNELYIFVWYLQGVCFKIEDNIC